MVGVGPVNSEFSTIATVNSDAAGTLTVNARIPDIAQNGSRWVMVVQAQDGTISTASNTFNVMPDGQGGGTGGANQYVVQSGDTLFGLALANDLTLAELLAANPQITNADRIDVGDTITIPAPGAPPPATGSPRIQLTPSSGVPGALVRLSASGFAPNDPLTIVVSPRNGEVPSTSASSRADAGGMLDTEILIPVTAAAGETWVVTVGGEAGGSAAAEFLVSGAGAEDGPVPGGYVVQPGDTLFRIALNNGTTVEAMMAANPEIADPTRIYVGQVLTLP